ncbi:copper homeostasis protein CutC [Devosia sp. MC532]|uniref:copper homeostasis protein CutC n=1 Tax=Devosia sp. MC532 TaxID=2799788 RepID=UPI0018F5B8B1|nr:copper homeostasis protein CutC [Devosia sp. MC532]MBJ7577661.1 copper homeostasis protein CutC [Devosia sp. MC532]
MTLLEVCVDSLSGIQAAVEGGADRIELCSSLEYGGLTPFAGLAKLASSTPIPVRMMVRPRAGDFVFDDYELAIMISDIETARTNKLGVVLGASLPSGALDMRRLEILCQMAGDTPRTLHRCVDLVPDVQEAVEQAIALGFDTILTSGRQLSAEAGIEDIAKMHEAAKGRITIMPGSGVSSLNARRILNRVPVSVVHASCSERAPAEDTEGAKRLGFVSPNRRVTSRDKVLELRAVLSAH